MFRNYERYYYLNDLHGNWQWEYPSTDEDKAAPPPGEYTAVCTVGWQQCPLDNKTLDTTSHCVCFDVIWVIEN